MAVRVERIEGYAFGNSAFGICLLQWRLFGKDAGQI